MAYALDNDATGHLAADESTARFTADPTPVRRKHMFDVPVWLDRATGWSWRLLVVALAVLAFGWALLRIRVVVVPILVALLIAALLAPVARRLRAMGLPSLVATWLVLLGSIVIVGGAVGLAAVLIVTTLSADADRWQAIGDDLRTWLTTESPVRLSESQVDDLWQRAKDGAIGGLQGRSDDAVRLIVEIGSGFFLGLVLLFFFVHDGDRMWRWTVARLSPQRADAIDDAGQRAVTTLGAYVRGLAITGLVDGVIIGIGLFLLGVPLALPLAILTFFGAFIPIVGATAAGALAAVVALATDGPTAAIITLALVIVVQQVEGDVVMPLVMRRQVRLHPAVILLAVTTGGALAGIVGALLAVPLAAVVVEVIAALRESAQTADLVLPTSPPDAATT